MKNILRLVIIMGMLAISFFISFSDVISIKKPNPALNGKMDLSKWDFLKNGPVNLDGQWELYDHQLLTPEDFEGKGSVRPRLTGYIKLTSTRRDNENNKVMEAEGIRTYRLVLKVKPSDRIFGLSLGNIRMSSRVYINGMEKGSNGNPSEQPEKYYGVMAPYDTYFGIDGSTVEIILQCANFEYPFTGTMYKMYFGIQRNIYLRTIMKCSVELSAIILMLLLVLYNTYMYCVRRKKVYLYFGINFFTAVVNLGLSGEKIFVWLFPSAPFELLCKTKNIFLVLMILSLMGVIKELNKNVLSKFMVNLTNILSLFYIAAVLAFSICAFGSGTICFYYCISVYGYWKTAVYN